MRVGDIKQMINYRGPKMANKNVRNRNIHYVKNNK